MQLLTTTIARILFAIPFLMFGMGHFMNAEAMTSMVPSWLPMPSLFNYLSGMGFVLAGIAIISKKMGKLACLLLAAELLIIILTMHIPSMMGTDENMKMMGMVGTFKDLGLMAGALTYAGIFAAEEKQVA